MTDCKIKATASAKNGKVNRERKKNETRRVPESSEGADVNIIIHIIIPRERESA